MTAGDVKNDSACIVEEADSGFFLPLFLGGGGGGGGLSLFFNK